MMLKDILLLASLIFLALAIIYHFKQEHEYKKWLRDLEQPVDSLLIKKEQRNNERPIQQNLRTIQTTGI